MDATVFAVDLERASSLAGISFDELVDGMRGDRHAAMHGVVLASDADCDANGEASALEALVLTSGKTTFYGVPFALQQLQRRTILEHALSQLLLAGITRVVLAVPANQPEVRAHLAQSPLAACLHLEYLELPQSVLESVPETLLAGRHLLSGPFLIHAPDRVFDKGLLERFLAFYETTRSICMLAETRMDLAQRMHPSTVRVQVATGNNTNVRIGRDLASYNGVDAGLYIVSQKIFFVLENLLHGTDALSLPEALAFGFRSLKVMSTTENCNWFGVDSDDQLLHAVEFNLAATLSPFTFPAAFSPQKPRKSVLLSVGSSPSSHASETARDAFQGFIVDVATTRVTATSPLLPRLSLKVHECALPTHVSSSPRNELSVSMPLPDSATSSPPKSAFLIQQSSASNFVLAVPDGPMRRRSQLPSDVVDVALEATTGDGAIAVRLTVQKQVPLVGYLILLTALLSVSAQGAALQTLSGISPFLKMFWRAFGSSCVFSALAFVSVLRDGWPMLQSPRLVVLEAMVCIVSYLTYNATFFYALDHTSVGHAYIFSNCHSVLIVFGKCFLGQPVAALESSGAFLGALGGALTSMDSESASSSTSLSTVIEPTLRGDVVALAGAIGGVFYLVNAKVLREKLGVWVFVAFLFTTAWLLILPLLCALEVEFQVSTDPRLGLFGWVHHLGTEVLIVVVCSGLGTMGFINAMRYFPPLVISVTMLLEPIVATLFSLLSGTADVPHALTMIGGLMVILGTLLVVFSTRKSTEHVDVTAAMLSAAPETTLPPRAAKRPSYYGTMS
ncbi:hypothetical protein SPRG_05347 [Saprolegnia parasitica CBS 223.65]|uniref:EamA domain-containing protein n=1 Tax=Saprolegnia parasitica (strain CBS 223.65) TaxID=695850 RepID=A0A067CLS8_SAPPC|nr:hypothetical protein SPRG_05347 [Saprolegnia parasitica CBS 223.65]KDO30155.1 hypothetical protein SPRG_05347 [Saprolegnia parasitica CBS 223.65]|eukprot:XP_012199333.1 hypothetical protein SPRG_05347 [Saprolegnia parasitica CBS 223.65]